jgi:alkanesulfonate monooxygenase SsuD/methylene tetrahydromethanopterin reductase-like flavin-dependent oxidoreductase (luciferase family)
MTLAAYAPHTSRIKLGTGVLPAFGKHPVALAYEAATLDEISGGRLILGVGMAHKISMENWYGHDMSKPLSEFKEYVTILRSIITTGRVEFQGEFYRTNFGFMGYAARPDIPIYTASLSPNSLRFAGEAADGIVLWSCMPTYIRDVVVPSLRAGAEAAGRDPASIEIVAAVPVALADDVEAARDAFRADFMMYMTLPFYRAAIAGAGYGDELDAFDAALASGDREGTRAAMTDRMLEEFTGIGDESAVRDKIAEYRAAGVTLPAIGTVNVPKGAGPGVEATLEAAIG